MMSPVQIGGLEATVKLQHRIMHGDLLGRDLQMRRLKGGSLRCSCSCAPPLRPWAMMFKCKVQSRSTVTSEVADKGDGKLLDYYRGFGFESGRQSL